MKALRVLLLLAGALFAAKTFGPVNAPTGRTGGFVNDPSSYRPPARQSSPVQGFAERVDNPAPPSPRDWDGNVTVDTMHFTDFACDYNYANGTMWVVTANFDSIARLYRSTDHGVSWQYVYWMGTAPADVYSQVGLVVGEGDSSFIYVYLRHRFNNGDIYMYRLKPDLSGWGFYPVSATPDTVNHFSVCRDFHPGYYLYAATSNQLTGNADSRFWRSTDYGVTWGFQYLYNVWDPVIRAGAGNVIGLAWTWPRRVGVWTEPNYSRGDPLGWKPSHSVGFDTFQTYYPTLAIANTSPDTEATMWVGYSYNWQNSSDWDVWSAVRYHAWGDTWRKGLPVSVRSDSSEWGADIESYKEPGNPYVDVTYEVADRSFIHINNYWGWSIANDPTTWSGQTATNDPGTNAGAWFNEERVIYSPGAPTSGGGVLFTHWDGGNWSWGLYFNAPWVTGVAGDNIRKAPGAGLRVAPTMTSGVTYITAPQGTKTVLISDATGRLVGRFERPSGTLTWNGFDLNGKKVGAGIYIIRAETGNCSASAKVVINR
jgi:hypothetical protein